MTSTLHRTPLATAGLALVVALGWLRGRGRWVTPVELLAVRLLLPLSITWGSRLLRRWRIPWVIRHVARLLFLY